MLFRKHFCSSLRFLLPPLIIRRTLLNRLCSCCEWDLMRHVSPSLITPSLHTLQTKGQISWRETQQDQQKHKWHGPKHTGNPHRGSGQIILLCKIHTERLYWISACLLCPTRLPRDCAECIPWDKRLSADMDKQGLKTHSGERVG